MKLQRNVLLIVGITVFALTFTGCSKDAENKASEVVNTSTLKTFKDVSFSLDYSEGFEAGRFFSTETGKSYKKSQIDASVMPKIDIAFYSGGTSLNYFVSPKDDKEGVSNKATNTDYINYVKDQYSVDKFTKLERGEELNSLSITNDNESFPDSKLPVVVLFKNEAGKKGVIFVKSVTRVGSNPRIVADIKIQK